MSHFYDFIVHVYHYKNTPQHVESKQYIYMYIGFMAEENKEFTWMCNTSNFITCAINFENCGSNSYLDIIQQQKHRCCYTLYTLVIP